MELDHEAGEMLQSNVIQYKNKIPYFYDEEGKFLHHEMAKYLIKEYNIIILEGQIYYYNGKKYVNDDIKIKVFMTKLLEIIKENQRNEVLHAIRYMAIEKEYAPARYIGLLNGIYDLKSKSFMDHTPELVLTNLINANYDPAATCEEIDNLFSMIGEGDEEVIQLLKEMLGYTMYRENSLEKSFLLKGEAGSGKSTLLNAIASFLGEENIISLSLSQLDGRFNTGLLKNKLANIGDDISYTTIKDTSTFKKLSTGERVTGEIKNETPFQFRSYAKLIFSGNRVPRMNDGSMALVDRFVIVPLNARIRGTDKQDPHFEKKITTDNARSYLLTIAIESLNELLKRGRFIIPDVVREELKEFDISNDPIKEWINSYHEEDKDIHNMPVNQAYNDYKDFCEYNGFKYPVSNKRLTQELKSHGYESGRPYVNGKQVRAYVLGNSIDI